jgi:hypothetical protein
MYQMSQGDAGEEEPERQDVAQQHGESQGEESEGEGGPQSGDDGGASGPVLLASVVVVSHGWWLYASMCVYKAMQDC